MTFWFNGLLFMHRYHHDQHYQRAVLDAGSFTAWGVIRVGRADFITFAKIHSLFVFRMLSIKSRFAVSFFGRCMQSSRVVPGPLPLYSLGSYLDARVSVRLCHSGVSMTSSTRGRLINLVLAGLVVDARLCSIELVLFSPRLVVL